MNETPGTKPGTGSMELGLVSECLGEAVGFIRLNGEVDVYSAPRLRNAMLEHIDAGRPSLIVELSEVTYLDSSGLGVLVAGLKRAKEHEGQVYIIAPMPRIMRVLEITGLDKVFTITATVDEALQRAERK